MRFLSPHSNYSVQVIQGREVRETDPVTGQAYTRTDIQPYVANFESGHGLFPHEVEMALQAFDGSFRGLPENTNPVTRIAIWDSEAHKVFLGWSDEYHEAIVSRLQVLAAQNPTRLIAVPDKWHAKPWPRYDEMDEDEILATIELTQIDPEAVRLYEGENQIREGLMQTLTQMAEGTYVAPEPFVIPEPGSGDDFSIEEIVAPQVTVGDTVDSDVVAVVSA